jgi:hypothetical protein
MSSNFVPRQDSIGPRLSKLSARAAVIEFKQHESYVEQLITELEKAFDNAENQAA